MKHLLLMNVIPELDIDFLNGTDIEFSFKSTLPNDSGWCDTTTGSRILDTNDQLMFVAINPEDELLLRLKFGKRLHDKSNK